MGRIHKNFTGICQLEFITFLQYAGEYLFKKVSVLESAGIVLAEYGEMGNPVHHLQSKEPAVSHIYFYFLYSLPHAFDAIQILDKGDFYQQNGVYAGTPVIGAVFISDQFVNKAPVNGLVNKPQIFLSAL